jgi:hypothetical protein
MTTDGPAAMATAILPPSVRWRIFVYLGALIVLLSLGSPAGGVIGVPIHFLLKNKLHLEARELANFRLIAAIPVYLAGLFGLARDTWNPFGLRDRGFIVLFGAISATLYVVFAFMPVTYPTLLFETILLTSAYLFVSSAQSGLSSMIGQQHLMTGQISAVWNIFLSLCGVGVLLIGGTLSEELEGRTAEQAVRILFLIGALFMAMVAIYGAWKPRTVFDHIHAENAAEHRPLEGMKRLLKHWPIYPALLIWLLWNFAPGVDTPLLYHIQNTLHATDAEWGEWNAIFAASFIPTFLVFGLLCRRLPLRTLLFWGTIVAIPQMIPLLFIHSMTGALIAAAPIGLMGGVATAAYLDLIIRSCPQALQGTTLMLSGSVNIVVSRFGDVLGTNLYEHYGDFAVCVIAITAVYALILPTLLLIPKPLIATADGETPAFALAA